MKVSPARRKIETPANTALTRTAGWTDLLSFRADHRWADRAWLFPRTAETSRLAEHALKAHRTFLMANRTAAEVIFDTALRQQAITFDITRAALGAYPAGMAGAGTQELHASWKRIMKGYAEACNEGLEVTQAVTDAAFKALPHAPGKAAAGRNDGASGP
ncbi:MAG TPA: hypothetical protein VIL69_01475 [Roseomonas sp.]|jgi:hypothetical protein